jgi:nucleoside-diphosphate-sugar epimerase
MRVLVTGHQGYIGSVLVPILLEQGHEVAGIDAGWFEGCDVGPRRVAIPSIKKDIRDITADDVGGFEAIIHLAALCNDALGALDPRLTYAINHEACVRLARLARAQGVRWFVQSSSCSIYGSAGEALVNEQAPAQPLSHYARAKQLAEQDLARLAGPDFSPVFLRNPTLYGGSPSLRFDLVLNNLVAWAAGEGCIHLKSDGAAWRPIVHVEDIARAIAAVLRMPRPAAHNQVFNMGTLDHNYRIDDLARIVAEVIPGAPIRQAEGAGRDARCYRVDVRKMVDAFPPIRAPVPIRDGIARLYEVLRPLAIRAEAFEGPRYDRVQHLQQLLAGRQLEPDLRRPECIPL